jgi:hypothetical protein
MFEAGRIPDIIVLSSFAMGGFAGVVGLASSMQPGSYLSDSTGRFAPWILIPIMIFAIVDQMRRTLKPRGITLSEEGIHWRDLKRSGTVDWEDLERVTLGAHRGMKRFYLHEYDGEMHIIEPSGLGSDPIIIAEVIEYFRTHPKDRNTLNDPRTALALAVEPIPNPSNQRKQRNTSGRP